MKPETLAAIEKACRAVIDGKYHDQFLVDWYQGGAGTSTNMNANEVLANVALELSGRQKAEYALAASLAALSAGYLSAIVLGIPAGMALGRFRLLNDALAPALDVLLAVPSVLLVPVFFGIFGLSRMTEVAVVFLYSWVVIIYMTRSGLAAVDSAHVEMARVFCASQRQMLLKVLLPGSLPAIMAGLRLGMGRAVRGMINGELLIGPVGLGALLRRYGDRFDAASVYGILVVVVALAVITSHGVRTVDRRVNGWAA